MLVNYRFGIFRCVAHFLRFFAGKFDSFDAIHRQERHSLVGKVSLDISPELLNFDWHCRIFWITAFLTSLFTCSYLIHQTYIKWENEPMFVTFNDKSTPAWTVSR